MSELSDKTLMVYDNGLFVSWAERLARDFGRVLLYVPWKDAFPKSNKFVIGQGMENVERVNDFWDYVPETDIFFFPDVYDGDLQVHLRSIGKPVWGSAKGEELELKRWETKLLLKEIGLPVQHCARVVGLDELREYLQENENQYVKCSAMRGDFETFYHDTYELTEPRLDELGYKLGARKIDKEFICEDAIDPAIEIGYDGITIDGQYPKLPMQGYEIKDLGYIGCVHNYATLPKQVREVNAKLAPIFEQYQYRGFFSSEIRIPKDGKAYLTDPCCRAASPPSELYQEMYKNWSEVIWYGAHGELVELEPLAKFGVQAMLHSSWADQNWQALYYPKEIAKWVKIRNMTYIGDKVYVAPQSVGLPEVGGVIATGNSIVEAVKKLKGYADQITGYTLEIKLESLPQAIQTIAEGEKQGIKFCDSGLPSIAQVEALLRAA